MSKIIWKGPNGHNALIGDVTTGMEIDPTRISEADARKLRGLGLIKIVEPTPKPKTKDAEVE